MGSAQLEFAPGTGSGEEGGALLAEARPSALRQEAAERLAAHRQRRERAQTAEGAAAAKPRSPRHRVAAAVAERYAQTPSYRAFLAEQAKLAMEEASAAAEVAMRNAEAIAQAQQHLLGELELWNAPQAFTPETAVTLAGATESKAVAPASRVAETVPLAAPRSRPERPMGLTVRLYEDLRQVPPPPASAGTQTMQMLASGPDDAEARALEAEIAFRQAPVFEDFWVTAEPPVPLPANLLEFPRQLVAARKARPRLAEGPLREEVTPRTAQLRIFEVEPEQISTAPAALSSAPEWASIRLDAHTASELELHPGSGQMALPGSLLPPQTAPLAKRMFAAAVDAVLVVAATAAFGGVFARLAGGIPVAVPSLLVAAGVLVLFHLIYQVLFFTFSDQTPGMRYARIGLCTFADGNPTRSSMRRRILAQGIAICPMGLGLLWVFLDDEGLGWHDRISRTYQRAY